MSNGLQCAYDYNSKKCTQTEHLDDDDLCIFHSNKEEKDVKAFKDALLKKNIGDFSGYVFPVQVTYEIFHSELYRGETAENIAFIKDMDFTKAVFRKGIMLTNMVFEKSLDMSECEFHGECNFSNSAFQDKVNFKESSVYGDGRILFNNIKIDNPMHFEISYTDLSRWSFMRTDVSKLNFKGCSWSDGRRIKYFRPKTKFVLYNEVLQNWEYAPICKTLIRLIFPYESKSKETEKRDYYHILELYRGLRMNYESRLQYQEAGDFHIGEMETRRLAVLQDKKPIWVSA